MRILIIRVGFFFQLIFTELLNFPWAPGCHFQRLFENSRENSGILTESNAAFELTGLLFSLAALTSRVSRLCGRLVKKGIRDGL
jgi:hypothetical protein